ncbi:MAG: hypothetical protein HY908_20675 [Myxococcales bacterium]|nr:hypothetical protein [Myxococcales bacterium]
MHAPLVARRFVPWRMFVGVGLIPLGGLLVYLHLFTELLGSGRKIYIMFLLLAGAISLGGVVLVTQSFARACVACKRPLESTSLCVPAEWEGWLCELAQSGHGPALGGLAQAPVPPPAYRSSALAVEYCPTCRRVAEIHAARRVPDGKGSFTDTKLTEPTVFAGPEVGWVVDLAKARAPQA